MGTLWAGAFSFRDSVWLQSSLSLTKLSSSASVFQYFGSLLVIFCVELASAVWTYEEVSFIVPSIT